MSEPSPYLSDVRPLSNGLLKKLRASDELSAEDEANFQRQIASRKAIIQTRREEYETATGQEIVPEPPYVDYSPRRDDEGWF